MPHSNRDELARLFGTFCHLWSKSLHAKVQMKTTESGGVLAQFEIELDKPHKPFPAGLPGFRRSQSHRAPRRHPGHESGSSNAPGQPGATRVSRRRPRRRGPKARVLDCVLQLTRLRWQLLAASRPNVFGSIQSCDSWMDSDFLAVLFINWVFLYQKYEIAVKK